MLAPHLRVPADGWPLSAPRRIAVFRALQLGDMLCAVPALRALRAAHRHAEIVLVGLPWAETFVRRFAHLIDGFLSFPGYPGLPEQAAHLHDVPRFLAAMQREQFDLAIQMHGNGTITNPLVELFGARSAAGYFQPGYSRPDPVRFIPYPDDIHEIRRHLRLLAALGVPPQGEHLEFPVRDRDRHALQQIALANGLTAGNYVCLHPGSRSARRWPIERFAGVGDALARAGLRVVITGTAQEAALTRELAGRMRAPAVDLAGQTDLGTAAALLQWARLVVCNNTGVSHLAAALRVPSVVLIENDAEILRWAPLDTDRHRGIGGLEAVAGDVVLAHCHELLQLGGAPAATAPEPISRQPASMLT
jgi:ADP-heptose:LPS heptosyltransferase